MPAIVLDCIDLDGEVAFLTREAGFRVHLVTPADDPRRIVLRRAGIEVELRRGAVDRPVHLVVDGGVTDVEARSPGGSIVEFRSRVDGGVLPENRPTWTHVDAAAGDFGVGRAGMAYRDLLPDRWGGRFIASHIRIDDGGDVADWVHFHRIRFQMIFVAAGWVDVVYEDQGEPFRMHAGDCVLQPPEIRHRVLRNSPGVEVIEIGCPAEHDTLADHELDLPTPTVDAHRDFGGQRFVRHVASQAERTTWIDPSLTMRDTGIGRATDGLAGAIVVGGSGRAAAATALTHRSEFVLVVGLGGHATLAFDGREVELTPRSSVAIPAGEIWRWTGHTPDHEALVVSLDADAVVCAVD